MTPPPSLGAIRADDDLLDALGRREGVAGDGLSGLLAAWTDEIDSGLRSAPTVVQARPRILRLRGHRVAAVVGAFALAMSGAGMAAALTGADLPLVSQLRAVASRYVNGDQAAAHRVDQQEMRGSLATARRKLQAGDLTGGQSLIDVVTGRLRTHPDESTPELLRDLAGARRELVLDSGPTPLQGPGVIATDPRATTANGPVGVTTLKASSPTRRPTTSSTAEPAVTKSGDKSQRDIAPPPLPEPSPALSPSPAPPKVAPQRDTAAMNGTSLKDSSLP